MQGEGGFIIHGGGIAVDEDQIPAVKIMNERSGRIDREGSACDDEHIGIDNSIQAFINGFAIKLFFIENNIRLDKTAAGTAGNAGRGEAPVTNTVLYKAIFPPHIYDITT